jgi:hypothetical protein
MAGWGYVCRLAGLRMCWREIRPLAPQRYSISANSPNYLSSFFGDEQKKQADTHRYAQKIKK